MSYFKDLSIYTYGSHRRYGEINVGWLDPDYPFPQGDVTPEFVEKLKQFCAFPVWRTRGIYPCMVCEPWEFYERKHNKYAKPEPSEDEKQKIYKEVHEVEINGKIRQLGCAEIRVCGKDGKIYAAPNLIYHYVAAHKYLPPQEFIDAVMTCPPDWCRYACIYPKNTGGILERLFSWGDPKPPVGELMWPEDNY